MMVSDTSVFLLSGFCSLYCSAQSELPGCEILCRSLRTRPDSHVDEYSITNRARLAGAGQRVQVTKVISKGGENDRSAIPRASKRKDTDRGR